MASLVEFKASWDPRSLAKWETFARSLDPAQTERLALEADKVHRKTVVQVVRSLILLSAVDTGRFRAAWTPFLQSQGIEFMDVVRDRRILPKLATGKRRQQIDMKAVSEGMKEGRVKDRPLDTTVVNNVAYAPYVEKRYGAVQKVVAWARRRQRENFRAWWRSIAARAEAGHPGFVGVDIEGGETIA